MSKNSTYNMSFGNLANAQTEKVILPLHHHCIACEQMLHSQEFNLQKVFCWGFEAGGDWAPGNLLMTEKGQIKKA